MLVTGEEPLPLIRDVVNVGDMKLVRSRWLRRPGSGSGGSQGVVGPHAVRTAPRGLAHVLLLYTYAVEEGPTAYETS